MTRILHQSVSDLAREHLRSRFPDAQVDQMWLEAAIQFVTGACMGLVIWWLENDAVPYSAEESSRSSASSRPRACGASSP